MEQKKYQTEIPRRTNRKQKEKRKKKQKTKRKKTKIIEEKRQVSRDFLSFNFGKIKF